MPNEFLSTYRFLHLPENVQRQVIGYLLGLGRPPAGLELLAQVTDPLARLDLLAQALLTPYKDYARAGSRREAGGLLQLYRSQGFQAALEQRRQKLAALGLLPDLSDLTSLPAFSFGLHFTFTLRAPYISKDEAGLHILDNPVRKDKVFGLPMVAPTGWKGALRAAMVRELVSRNEKLSDDEWIEQRLQLIRLFGNETEVGLDDRQCDAYLDKCKPAASQAYRERLKAEYSDTGFFAGRLVFYPTFFTRLDLEVINPHDRQSNAGQQPIYFECVPADAEGTFTLLYVPFDRIGEPAAETCSQVAEDLPLVVAGVEAMLTRYGFGAKTTVGCGLAEAEFARDAQGKPLAYLRIKGVGNYRCRNFAGLHQAAETLIQALRKDAGGAQ
jgi:CRISPR-associated protein Cmr2